MTIPTLTEMYFPKTEEGKKAAIKYSEDIKKMYPMNSRIEEDEAFYVLILGYSTEYEVPDGQD